VVLADGPHEARFRTVRVKAEAAPYGRVYFCQHFTPELVWRAEWRGHPNGAMSITRAVILSPEPERTALLYRKLFGDEAVRATADGFSLAVGEARLDMVTRAWGVSAQAEDKLLGVAIRTKGQPRLIPAEEAFGAIVDFVA
jgi:hypothetical protein